MNDVSLLYRYHLIKVNNLYLLTQQLGQFPHNGKITPFAQP